MNFITSWPILVTISVFTYAVSVLLQKTIMKDDKSDPVAFAVVFQALVGIVIGIGALVHGFVMPDLLHYWPNIVLMIILYGAGNIAIFQSLKLIDASTYAVLVASRSLWTVAGALLFLGEHYTWVKLVGVLLIIASIVIVSGKKQRIRLGKGELLALLVGLIFGAAFVNDAFVVQHSDVLSYETLALILPALGIVVAHPRAVKQIPNLIKGSLLLKILLLSIFFSITQVAVYSAYKIGHNASQIAPLIQTTTVVTVILSMIFLKEKTALIRKSIGAVISFIGVILVG